MIAGNYVTFLAARSSSIYLYMYALNHLVQMVGARDAVSANFSLQPHTRLLLQALQHQLDSTVAPASARCHRVA